MKNNRFLKVLAVVMAILMMSAIAIPAFAADIVADAGDDAAVLTPIETDATYDKWDGSFDTTPFEHITDHSQDYASADPIIIDTAEKLAGLAKYTNDAKVVNKPLGAFTNQRFYITKNMDMMCLDFPIIGQQYDKAMFSGLMEGRLNNVEGAAVTIANLSVPMSSGNNAGFIGTLRGGGVKNLTFVNATVGNSGTGGGNGIVVGYVSKTIQFFENITVIDSTLIAGKSDSYNGYLVGVAKVDSNFTMKNCAAINCSTVTAETTAYAGGLTGILQKRNTTVYTFENCSISGCTTTDGINLLAGFAAKVEHNPDVATEYVFNNCHYNANLKQSDEDLNYQGILIADATGGATVAINGLLITGANDGAVDGATPLIAYVDGSLTVTAQNIYSTVDVTSFGDTSLDVAEIAVTKVEKSAITGAAAATTLAGFDFTNVWATRDGKIATLKIAVADEYVAAQAPGATPNPDPEPTPDPEPDPDPDPTPTPGENDTTTTTTTAKADDAKKDDGGCGSVVSATCLVTLLTVGMGVTVIRKKKD